MTGSWVPGADQSPFPLAALPFGVVIPPGEPAPRVAVAIGEHALDLASAAGAGLLDGTVDEPLRTFSAPTLNPFLAAGRPAWSAVRARLTELLGDEAHRGDVEGHLLRRESCTEVLPIEVADYVDFYSSREHAENLGRMFRPDSEPLLPNWLHLPVGYHGRSGTVVVSGTPVQRPCGQRKAPDADTPTFGPSQRLDIELEVGFVVGGPGTELGQPVAADDVRDHVFGVCLVNDWSARDIQAWEYQPLGPFLGKSFATSMSAWILPLDALEAARVAGPPQRDPEPLPYLRTSEHWGLSLDLEVWLRPAGAERAERISVVNAGGLYWSCAQQLAHLTVNGATVRPGDLFASGTVSGDGPGQRGSLIEMTWNGRDPVEVAGVERTFLEDGDEVVLRGSADVGGVRVHLGDVAGRIEPCRCT